MSLQSLGGADVPGVVAGESSEEAGEREDSNPRLPRGQDLGMVGLGEACSV